jgi:HK97 family phage portal protein
LVGVETRRLFGARLDLDLDIAADARALRGPTTGGGRGPPEGRPLMGYLSRLAATATSSPRSMRAATLQEYTNAFFSGEPIPDLWRSTLMSAGIDVTPDLARTLSAVACGVNTIAYDLATLPCQTFRYRDDGGRDRVIGRAADWAKGGIGDLAYMLQWAPNTYQTATEFFAGQVLQFLLRGKAYAEIVGSPRAALAQLLPRHPDRVFPERLANGNIRYKLIEATGQPRYVSSDEMHVVRDIATDPLAPQSMTQFAAASIGTSLAAEMAAAKFFKSGMTAALLAQYPGEKDDEGEAALHKSITRFASGVEHSFGLMLIPDEIKIEKLAIEPEKAQMMLAREWTVYEVARWLRISPRKLMARPTSGGYNSAFQDAIDHVVGCLRPLAHVFEQAMQRDLIIAKDTYFVKFYLRELLRGDPTQEGDFIQKMIQSRAMRPSEVRTTYLDLNPDEELDRLSENDNQPGKAGGAKPAPASTDNQQPQPAPSQQSAHLFLRGVLVLHDNAMRCVRRERVAVERLVRKHPHDVGAWHRGLREFYGEHARYVADLMRLPIVIARGYAAQHGKRFEVQGGAFLEGEGGDSWEQAEGLELAALAFSEDAKAA